MQLSHAFPARSAVFDDPNLVSCAGLVPALGLAQRAGLRALADRQLTVPGGAGHAWTDGRLVVKPVGCLPEHNWVCDVYAAWTATEVRVPEPVMPRGSDEVDWSTFGASLKVYIGHHGDKGAHAADIILPAAAYSEKDGTYVNTEGRVQFAEKAVFAPGDAREDWTILRALADALGVNVGFDSFAALQAAMIAEVPALGIEGLANYGKLPAKVSGAGKGRVAKVSGGRIAYPIQDFYLTNPIARASVVMQRCSAELLHGEDFAEAAE